MNKYIFYHTNIIEFGHRGLDATPP